VAREKRRQSAAGAVDDGQIRGWHSEEDALGLLFEGETNRAIAEHQLNKASSRSHTLFSMTLEVRPQGAADERVLVSKLHMVDLAGSERLSKTKSEGTVAREAQYINKSLSFLEQVGACVRWRLRGWGVYCFGKAVELCTLMGLRSY
jgi:hypothetical protein